MDKSVNLLLVLKDLLNSLPLADTPHMSCRERMLLLGREDRPVKVDAELSTASAALLKFLQGGNEAKSSEIAEAAALMSYLHTLLLQGLCDSRYDDKRLCGVYGILVLRTQHGKLLPMIIDQLLTSDEAGNQSSEAHDEQVVEPLDADLTPKLEPIVEVIGGEEEQLEEQLVIMATDDTLPVGDIYVNDTLDSTENNKDNSFEFDEEEDVTVFGSDRPRAAGDPGSRRPSSQRESDVLEGQVSSNKTVEQAAKKKFVFIWKCRRCKFSTKYRSSYFKHLKWHARRLRAAKIIKAKPRYKCEVCSKVLKYNYSYKRHLCTHYKKTKYECEPCEMTFLGVLEYAQHLDTHGDSRPFPCKQCSKSFASEAERHDHLVNSHGYMLCDTCNKAFSSMAGFRKHRCPAVSRQPAASAVGEIDQSVESSSNPQPVNPQPVPTLNLQPVPTLKPQPIATLNKQPVATLHTQPVTAGSLYQPNRSAGKHVTQENLAVIKVEQADPASDEADTNEECGESSSASVPAHDLMKNIVMDDSSEMKIVEGKRIWVCSICDKQNTLHHNHRRHKLRHMGIHKFKCQYCGRGFDYKHRFEDHLKRHMNLKMYRCSNCLKDFYNRECLSQHIIKFHGREYLSEYSQDLDMKGLVNKDSPVYAIVVGEGKLVGPKEKQEVSRNLDMKELGNKDSSTYAIVIGEGKLVGPKEKQKVSRKQDKRSSRVKSEPTPKPDVTVDLRENEVVFKCSKCSSEFSSEADATQHTEVCRQLIECAKCGEKYMTGEKHNKQQCKKALEAYRQKINLDPPDKPPRPKRRLPEHEALLCVECNKKFYYKTNYQRHMAMHRGDHKKYTCNFCDKTFSFKHRYKYHIAGHYEETKYRCGQCSQGFPDKATRQEHMDKQHTVTTHQCENCGRVYKCLRSYRGHDCMRPPPSASVLCSHCGKSFPRNTINRHIDLAHGKLKGPHTCKICACTYRTFYHFRLHMDQHEGLRMFKCDKCTRSFRSKIAYTEHVNEHNGVKPYVCDFCGLAFARKTSHREHQLKHTQAHLTFPCQDCGKTFPNDKCLRTHERRVHKKFRSNRVGYGFDPKKKGASEPIQEYVRPEPPPVVTGEESNDAGDEVLEEEVVEEEFIEYDNNDYTMGFGGEQATTIITEGEENMLVFPDEDGQYVAYIPVYALNN